MFFCEHIHEFLMGADDLCKKCGRLLPLPFLCDVAVIASAKRKHREKVRLVLEIIAQPTPRGVVSPSHQWEGRWSVLGIFADERRYLHRIHIADRAKAASPA